MAVVKGLTLPQELKDEIHRTVASFPVDALVELAAEDKAFAPGIRATASAAEQLRKRLRALVDGSAMMPPRPLDALRRHSFQQQFVCVLSEMALTDAYGFGSMAAFCGGARLLVGMLLDPRGKVAAKAVEFINSGKPIAPPPATTDDARKALDAVFGPFIDELSRILLAPAIASAEPPPPEKQKDPYAGIIRTNAKLTHQVETLQKKVGAERQRVLDAKKTAESAGKDAARTCSELKTALKEIDGLKALLAAKTGEAAKAIKTAEAEKTAKSFALEAANRAKADCSKKLEEKDNKVAELRTELSIAMEKIEQLEKSGAIDSKEQFIKSIDETIPIVKRTPRTVLSETLNQAVGPNDKPVFLIDGHNAINTMPRYAAQETKGMKHEELRNLFVKDVCEYQRLLQPCEIRIHFDGPKPAEYAALGNSDVKIVYSGGTGDHRADYRIIQYVDFLAMQPGNRIAVITVSDDGDLRSDAAQSGSLLLHLDEFFSLF